MVLMVAGLGNVLVAWCDDLIMIWGPRKGYLLAVHGGNGFGPSCELN